MTRRTLNQPITAGTWNRIASKHYRHVSGIEVRYSHNNWVWEVVGGPVDGLCWKTLGVAQHFAVKGI